MMRRDTEWRWEGAFYLFTCLLFIYRNVYRQNYSYEPVPNKVRAIRRHGGVGLLMLLFLPLDWWLLVDATELKPVSDPLSYPFNVKQGLFFSLLT